MRYGAGAQRKERGYSRMCSGLEKQRATAIVTSDESRLRLQERDAAAALVELAFWDGVVYALEGPGASEGERVFLSDHNDRRTTRRNLHRILPVLPYREANSRMPPEDHGREVDFRDALKNK
jgi:hypothetical protein